MGIATKIGCNPAKIKIIANDNLSGGLPWEKRVDFLEFEKDVNLGFCKRLIVYRNDRLSRDFEVSGKLLNLLIRHNIELYDESGKFDYQTTSGRAFFGMKSVFAGFERSMIRDRTVAGKLVKAKRGLYVGGRIPIGLCAGYRREFIVPYLIPRP